ncbi:outer membrane protein assembly factor BamE [Seleniivibrio sp.]|uniref:outer membrane protein assembly factor BamE domain-containing protein n=1 Tax=Seleniivibrio sp. TaxID=2898801 RepID=UPI0025DAF432|nr:outer membrane protein assembly factor BamE [Seleniivibrio sp.]MCD8554125.1 outer membrane protein assembly factor BamE [Seleniivibrio sp.]
MSKLLKLFFVIVLMTTIFGCVSMSSQSGNDFDVSAVNQIKQNQTTKSEILSIFGTPYSKSRNVINGVEKETWMYMYMNVQSHAKGFLFTYNGTAQVDHKSLVIVFNGETVESYNMTANPGTSTLNTTIN